MSQFEKLMARIRSRPPEADFADVDALLKAFGWTKAREVGSHVSYTKEGAQPITVSKKHGRKVKRVYLDKICKLLDLDD
jgi:predicted RNA binding protein YcfA (HicA-like mRNA interferase family)